MSIKYYIGLDAHSRNCVFVVLDRRGNRVKRGRVPTNEPEILSFVRSIRGKKALVLEETGVSQWLYVLLKSEVDELVVCNPVGRRGPKTDYIDAEELADLLRVGRLKPVFHTLDDLMELRLLVSGYDDLVHEHVQMKNRYSALFRRYGIGLGANKLLREPERIETLPNSNQRFVGVRLQERIELLSMQKTEYEALFKENVKKYRPIELIMSVPGFGPTLANQLVGIVVSPHRFATKYKFFSYSMLVWHFRESDGKVYGKQQAHGRPKMKAIFQRATIASLRGDNVFRRRFEDRVSHGMEERAARSSTRRDIAAAVLGVWKSGAKFDGSKWEVTRKQSHIEQKESPS